MGEAALVSVVSVSKTENIFPRQILFKTIQLHLCCLPSLIVQVLGQGQSEKIWKKDLAFFVRRQGSEALCEALAKN